jgi:hypothetical protein
MYCVPINQARRTAKQSRQKTNWSNGVDQTSSSCAAHSHTVTASWATISHTISGATRELGPLKGQSGGGEKSLCDTPQRIRQRDFLGFSQKQQTAHRTPACFYFISQGLGCQWDYSQMYIIHTRRHAGRAPGLVLQPLKIQRRGSRERERERGMDAARMALPASSVRQRRPSTQAVRMWSRTQLVLLTLTSLILILKGT